MIDRIAIHAAALALAAVTTLGALAGMNGLAAHQYAGAAADAEPVQQVVIVGQRLPRA